MKVVGQYVEPGKVNMKSPAGALGSDAITIGEALETTALTAGDKPVDQSDAAAIQAAEVRASGYAHPGGVASAAQSAADFNARTLNVENKAKLGDVLAVSHQAANSLIKFICFYSFLIILKFSGSVNIAYCLLSMCRMHPLGWQKINQ